MDSIHFEMISVIFCLPQQDSLVVETSLRELVIAKAKTMAAAAVKREAIAMAVPTKRK